MCIAWAGWIRVCLVRAADRQPCHRRNANAFDFACRRAFADEAESVPEVQAPAAPVEAPAPEVRRMAPSLGGTQPASPYGVSCRQLELL